MKICPNCHDEYRDNINRCLQCDIDLEIFTPGMSSTIRAASKTEEIDFATAVKVFEGQMDACREIEAVLKREKIACALVPHGVVEGGDLLGRKEMAAKQNTYLLCVNADKVESYLAIMKARFDDMVAREHAKEITMNEVNLDGGDVQCPACGHVGPLVAGHCSDCELFLGVNEA